jgi:hypothetical protein
MRTPVVLVAAQGDSDRVAGTPLAIGLGLFS